MHHQSLCRLALLVVALACGGCGGVAADWQRHEGLSASAEFPRQPEATSAGEESHNFSAKFGEAEFHLNEARQIDEETSKLMLEGIVANLQQAHPGVKQTPVTVAGVEGTEFDYQRDGKTASEIHLNHGGYDLTIIVAAPTSEAPPLRERFLNSIQWK